MTSPEPSIRVIDANEHALVLTVDLRGRVMYRLGGVCPAAIAALLRDLASRMEAASDCSGHGETPNDEPTVRDDEPLIANRGALDEQRRVWTDGTGHRWDLSVSWDDVTGVRWEWTGRVDKNGAPLMRSNFEGGEISPLDVVRAVTGPIVPVTGSGA